MKKLYEQFSQWGRVGGLTRARRLLKAKNRRKSLKSKEITEKAPKKRGPKPIPLMQDARGLDMVQMYKSGLHTLESIGAKYGITRERVRQILKRYDIDAKDSNLQKVKLASKISKTAQKEKRRQESIEKTYSKWLHCSRDQYISLTGAEWNMAHYQRRNSNSPANAYVDQFRNAINRKIEWNITFPEWWDIWEKSGKWERRGRGQGKYVMARIGDWGAYEKDNVYICLSVENNSEKGVGKKSNLPMGVSAIGKKFQARKMIDGKMRYVGTFDTPEEAHEAYLKFNGKK